MAVLSGLQAGERVVIDGADRLRDGAKVTVPRRPQGGSRTRRRRPAAAAAPAPAAPAGATPARSGSRSAGGTGRQPAARRHHAPARPADGALACRLATVRDAPIAA